MNTEYVISYLQVADEDLDSAKAPDEVVRKYNEIICYFCTQAAKGYLNAYLTYYDIVPRGANDIVTLTEMCVEKNSEFQKILTLSTFLNKFADVRYIPKYKITEDEVNDAIDAVEKIRSIRPIVELRNSVNNSNINN
jgi:HEPN domain-containing protein